MKKLCVLLMLFAISVCYGQVYDTTVSDKGKPGGFERIRELDNNGNIQRIWISTWNQGVAKKIFFQQGSGSEASSQIESTFTADGTLRSVHRDLGPYLGQEELEFTPSGQMLRKSIFLFVKNSYMIYRKDYDGVWHYSALADGNPPKPVSITEDEFTAAEHLFLKTASERMNQQMLGDNSHEVQDRVIAQFNGNDIRNTKPFVVSSPWEVQWDAKGEFFSIYLYSEDGSLVNVLGNQNTPGEGSSYFPKSGKYYFSISTLGDWSVKVVKAQ